MARTGRPRKVVDWTVVDAMLKCQATEEEIAAYLGLSVDTLCRGCKAERKMTFAELSLQKRKVGAVTLRQRQIEIALDGSIPMLIFLGKQYLGQSDRDDVTAQDAIAEFKSLAGPLAGNGQVKGNGKPKHKAKGINSGAKRLGDAERDSS